MSGKSLSRQTSEKEAGSGSSCHPTPFILARGSPSVEFPKSSKPLIASCSLHQSDPCGGRKPGEKRALAGFPSWPWPSAGLKSQQTAGSEQEPRSTSAEEPSAERADLDLGDSAPALFQ